MMLAVAVVFYALAGLFLSSATVVGMLAPADAPPEALPVVFGMVGIVGALLWLIGAACVRFRGWRGHLGWVLLGAGGMGGLTIYSVFASIHDPAVREAMGSRSRALMENADPTAGGVVAGGLLAIGAVLVFLQARRDARERAVDSASVAKVFD